jgi:CRISPR-associated protein Csb2
VQSLERGGWPAPVRDDVVRSAVLPGSAKPRTFPRFPPDTGRPQRVLVHARLEFAEPVRGPILAGAGRYLGLGLFRPMTYEAEGRP